MPKRLAEEGNNSNTHTRSVFRRRIRRKGEKSISPKLNFRGLQISTCKFSGCRPRLCRPFCSGASVLSTPAVNMSNTHDIRWNNIHPRRKSSRRVGSYDSVFFYDIIRYIFLKTILVHTLSKGHYHNNSICYRKNVAALFIYFVACNVDVNGWIIQVLQFYNY